MVSYALQLKLGSSLKHCLARAIQNIALKSGLEMKYSAQFCLVLYLSLAQSFCTFVKVPEKLGENISTFTTPAYMSEAVVSYIKILTIGYNSY